jgi:regulator of RNase E activity RraA
VEFRNGVRVAPGDVIVGDIDGVLVIPKEHVQDIVRRSVEKVAGEEDVRRAILEGERTEAVFERTGIM